MKETTKPPAMKLNATRVPGGIMVTDSNGNLVSRLRSCEVTLKFSSGSTHALEAANQGNGQYQALYDALVVQETWTVVAPDGSVSKFQFDTAPKEDKTGRKASE